LLGQTRRFRTWGDCYGYLLVACGGADIMPDPVMNPWDILPLVPIIQGAGGVITTWFGGDAARGDSCVAANKILHPRVLEILNS
jgi:fructose-1,6-bisphosphatase/inositol monophosphatase family enzyme